MRQDKERHLALRDVAVWVGAMGIGGLVKARDSAISDSVASVAEPVELHSIIVQVDDELLKILNNYLRVKHMKEHLKAASKLGKCATCGRKVEEALSSNAMHS